MHEMESDARGTRTWPGEDRLPADRAVVATYVGRQAHRRGVGRARFAATASGRSRGRALHRCHHPDREHGRTGVLRRRRLHGLPRRRRDRLKALCAGVSVRKRDRSGRRREARLSLKLTRREPLSLARRRSTMLRPRKARQAFQSPSGGIPALHFGPLGVWPDRKRPW